jgi:GxxExxY protein
MNGEAEDYKHSELTNAVICCFYTVYNALGYGFLEKVYESALLIELTKRGIKAVAQHPIKVYYNEAIVGEYFADILVEETLLIEIKAARSLAPEHHAQLLNYLKATEIEVGLLLNFGVAPEIKRKVYENNRK